MSSQIFCPVFFFFFCSNRDSLQWWDVIFKHKKQLSNEIKLLTVRKEGRSEAVAEFTQGRRDEGGKGAETVGEDYLLKRSSGIAESQDGWKLRSSSFPPTSSSHKEAPLRDRRPATVALPPKTYLTRLHRVMDLERGESHCYSTVILWYCYWLSSHGPHKNQAGWW